MTDLEDAFGEDFAEGVQETIAEKRRERNRVTEEQKKEIAQIAINENKFNPEEPRFQYTTDNGITHNVLLMQVPDMENRTVWEYLSEPWEGAAKLPLDYLGEWMSCTFPDKNDVKVLDTGEWYIVIGGIDIYTTDEGEERENVYPVRGVVSLEDAKEWAQEGLEDEGFPAEEESSGTEETTTEAESESEPPVEDFAGDESEEPEQEQQEESDAPVFDQDEEEDEDTQTQEEEDDDDEELFSSDEEEDEEEDEEGQAPYFQVKEEVEKLAEQNEEVWDVEPDTERMDRVVEVLQKKLGWDDEDAIRGKAERVIKKHNEEDEEEEETGKDKLF